MVPKTKSQKISICKTCGKEFTYYPTKTRGKFCCKKCQWNFQYPGCYWIGKNGYLYHQTGRGKKTLVHRKIMGITDDRVVHHKNGNKLDNSLTNLEILPNQGVHIKQHNPVLARWGKA